MDVLINLIVVIILQSIHVSNHHIAHNIICQLYLNKAGEKILPARLGVFDLSRRLQAWRFFQLLPSVFKVQFAALLVTEDA